MAKRILLAEDSRTVQKMVQMTFAVEDVAVVTASTPDEALAKAREQRPDLAIVDLSMGGKGGYELCAAIKSLGPIPVLLLHGSASVYDEGKASAAGADGAVAKPFETQGLIDKVKGLVDGPVRSVRATGAAPAVGAAHAAPLAAAKPLSPLSAPKMPVGSSPAAKLPSAGMTTPGISPIQGQAPSSIPQRPAAAPMVAPVAPTAQSRPSGAMPRVSAAPAIPATSAASPMAMKPPGAAAPAPVPVRPAMPQMAPISRAQEPEITIEAEPPPLSGADALPSFTSAGNLNSAAGRLEAFAPAIIESSRPSRPQRTLMGMNAPEMLSSMVAPAAVAAAIPAAAATASATGQVDPAVYDAVSRLSREVIERIVWEVVPDLAESIIREQLDRLVEQRQR